MFAGKACAPSSPWRRGELNTAEIEPDLITNLFDSAREKRRRVRYDDLPAIWWTPVLSAEDKRFFEHGALISSVSQAPTWADIRQGSTHSRAQHDHHAIGRARFSFPMSGTWRRKLAEAMVSVELEQRFSKQQIFEMYANEVYLGIAGASECAGFAEASVAYFART